MIPPELFSDSQQAFKHFRDVTNPSKFLKSKELVHPRWRLVLCFAALPAAIWLVHFFLVHRFFPPSIVHVITSFYVMTLPKDVAFWLSCVNVGTIAWVIAFFVPYICFRSRWIKKALASKAIPVKGWNWFGPEVQRLMLQDFTHYLADRGFNNAGVLSQLIADTRDEIETMWRPIPVMLTLFTLGIALLIACLQPLFSQLLVIVHASIEDIATLAKLVVVFFVPIFIYGYVFYSLFFARFRRERAIYMHRLSDIRLSLLSKMNSASTASDNPIATPEGSSALQHVLAVLTLSQNYSGTLGSRVTDISKLWSVSLFTRSIVALNSAIILITERANDDAAILVRTLFEIEFQLGAIKADPSIAVRLIKATEKFRGGRLRALIESKRELPQGITEEAVREQLDIAGSSGAANVNIIELAEKAGLSYEYKTIYSVLCDIAHVSPMGLAHYLIDDPVARNLRVNPNGSLLDPEYLMVLAAATQLNIVALAAQILNDTHPHGYEELRSANAAKIQKIHETMFE